MNSQTKLIRSSQRSLTQTVTLFAILISVALLSGACDDDIPGVPVNLKSPANFVYAPSCVTDGRWQAPEACDAGQPLTLRGYITNEHSGSIAYIDLTGTTPKLLDAKVGVPGISPVPVGERPRALVASRDGAFLMTVNTASKDISIVEVDRQREVKRISLDVLPLDMISGLEQERFWLAFQDGHLESRVLHFSCGGEVDVYLARSEDEEVQCDLDTDGLTFEIEHNVLLPGRPNHMLADPTRPLLYVSYLDQTYLSIIGLEGSEESCLLETDTLPCEIARLPGGFGCSDGIDGDGDGLIDGQDPQCYGRAGAESPTDAGLFQTGACSDGIDNNNNGLFDLLDPGCLSINDASEDPGLQAPTLSPCVDGIDNDGDGLTDNRDPDCAGPNSAEVSLERLSPACDDGVDNDNDGFADFPHDPGCVSFDDNTEGEVSACADGIDNDGDGLIDLNDPGCANPEDLDERSPLAACNDGIDNDGDGFIDLGDKGCYGAQGLTEEEVKRSGLGPLGIDPQGRWLYVIDRSEWQVLILDLETRTLLPAGLLAPKNTGAGIRVNPLPISISGDVRRGVLNDNGATRLIREDAVFLVASSSGVLDVGNIHQSFFEERYSSAQGSESITSREALGEIFTLRREDSRGSSAQASSVRCLSDNCIKDSEVQLRQRRTIRIEENNILDVDEEGAPLLVPADEIFSAETWSVIFEGVLPNSTRSDALVDASTPGRVDGRGANYCTIGVRPGDRFILKQDLAQDNGSVDLTVCDGFFNSGAPATLEWRISKVRKNTLFLETIDGGDFAQALPSRGCFNQGLSYEIRPSEEWIVVGSVTNGLSSLDSVGDVCVSPEYGALGEGRFKTGDFYQNAFFSLNAAQSDIEPTRESGFEFDVRTNYVPLQRSIGPLPMDLDILDNGTRRFIMIPDAGSNQVIIYDADTLSVVESL